MTLDPTRGWLSIKEAAERLGVSEQTLRRWDRSGKLKAHRHPLNNYRQYPASEIDALRPRPRTPRRLPAPRDRFIGRADLIADTLGHLDDGARLITLHGSPGIGKTRLAIEIVARSGREALWCDLSEAATQVDIEAVVSAALSHAGQGRDGDLGARLEAAGGLLMVLDNFEQVTDHGPETIGRWLDEAPGLQALVTSRQRLRLSGEVVATVAPLPCDESISPSEALTLFLDRVGASGEAIDRDTAAEIVRRLEGVPLAIELAAARTSVLGTAGLLRRLDSSPLDALGKTNRDRSGPGETLSQAIEWSWQRLDRASQAALAQISVFRGGFDVEAAEAVLALPDGASAIDALDVLCEQALLQTLVDPHRAGERRFKMLLCIRAFGETKLSADQIAAAQARHAAWILTRARVWADAALFDGDPEALGRLEANQENLLTAQRSHNDDPAVLLLLAVSLDPVRSIRGPVSAHLDMLDAAIDAQPEGADESLLARALEARGRNRRALGQLGPAAEDQARARQPAERAGDARMHGLLTAYLGLTKRRQGALDEARTLCLEAIEALRDTTPRFEAIAQGCLGSICVDEDKAGAAAHHYGRALALAQRLGDLELQAEALGSLGNVYQDTGKLAQARRCYERSLSLYHDLREPLGEGIFRGYLASLLHEQGDPDAARGHYVAAVGMLQTAGLKRFEGLFRAHLGLLMASKGDRDTARETLAQAGLALESVSDPTLLAVLALHRAHLRLLDEGHLPEVEIPEGLDSDDLRFARRLLAQACQTTAPCLRVAPEGRAVVLPTGERVDLSRRGPARRLLMALITHRETKPGQGLGWDALLDQGWPGERMRVEAGAHRVRVTIWTLRRHLGLQSWLHTGETGYFIDPALEIVRVDNFDDL